MRPGQDCLNRTQKMLTIKGKVNEVYYVKMKDSVSQRIIVRERLYLQYMGERFAIQRANI